MIVDEGGESEWNEGKWWMTETTRFAATPLVPAAARP